MNATPIGSNSHKQRRLLLRTQVIPIYDKEDDDSCPCYSTTAKLLKTHDVQKKRRRRMIALLLMLIISFVMMQSAFDKANSSQTEMKEHLPLSSLYPLSSFYNSSSASSNIPTTTSLHEVSIPQPFDNNIANIYEPMEHGREMPYFFHIPRAAGSTIKDILGKCAYIRVAWNTTSFEEETNLIDSGQVDMITTQYLHEGATLFDGEKHRGRCFTMMRHPIERAVSLFHYLGIAKHEPTYDPQLKYISIEMWARSNRVEFNWMTRFLSNELDGDLTPTHVAIAKKILKEKCLVGLLEEKVQSWLHFEKYFGWRFNQEMRQCHEKLWNYAWSSKHQHEMIEEGSEAWELLYKQNRLDMELYKYATQIFEEQRLFLFESV
jgi:hypothetical protein